MGLTRAQHRRLNGIAIVLVGLLSFVCSAGLVIVGSTLNAGYDRWQAALVVEQAQQANELSSVTDGRDVVLIGTIDPVMETGTEGLAIYNYWRRRVSGTGASRRHSWEYTAALSNHPTFRLLVGDDQGFFVQSRGLLDLRLTRDAWIDGSGKVSGFAPGDGVTVFGTVASTVPPLQIRANAICGGEYQKCLETFSRDVRVLFIVAGVLILAGGGVIWVGIRQLRDPGG
jgi:hypothetical protein